MSTIHANAIDFYEQRNAEQPRAVFLHGFGGDLQTWDLVWAALDDRVPALRYDLRGFGQSRDDSAAPFHHADDLLAILDALHIAQCDLIGVSMGGAVALNFALDHPERVRNLILISPGMVAWEWSEVWFALWRPITAKARAGDMEGARQLWWQHPLFASTRESEAASELFESIQRYSGAQWVRDYEKRSMPDVDRLYSLKPRTLLLTGARDVDDFRLLADIIEASAPTITRIDNPDCGHLLQLEAPQFCAREILAFLDNAASR